MRVSQLITFGWRLAMFSLVCYLLMIMQMSPPPAQKCPHHDSQHHHPHAKVIAPNSKEDEADTRPGTINQIPELKDKSSGFIDDKAPDAKSADIEGATPMTTQKPVHFNVDKLDTNSILDPDLAPNVVHYVWCGRRWFEFHHYLSVMSTIRELKPDNIMFHYQHQPILDEWIYNTWFIYLKEEFPFLRLVKRTEDDNACSGSGKANVAFISWLLTRYGGVYMSEYTILNKFPINFRSYDFVNGLDSETGYGFILAKRGMPGKANIYQLADEVSLRTRRVRCLEESEFRRRQMKDTCVNIPYTFFPKDIWELDDDWGGFIRNVFYGKPEVPLPKPSYDELIPNIAHIVWIGRGEMDYLFYLGVLSLLYVAEVEFLYIHGDGPPSGEFWERIKDHERLRLIYRETPYTVFGTRVNVLSHVTDVWRVDFMIKYGGIYVDTDVIWVKPLDREIRGYDAIATYDFTYWNPPYPDTINFGVTAGKRNAKYWHLFQKSMNWFIDKDWSWNGLRQPYKIKERHPELLLINTQVQVTCFRFLCHPTWYPGYHNESIHHLNTGSIQDWKTDAYAFHFTLPTPPMLLSEENLAKADKNDIFTQIAHYVLEKAGRPLAPL